MSDIFRTYNYSATSDSVKIPDVDFDLPRVTIEEQEKLVYPTREELAEFYRDELNAIALEVEIKAYSDALQSKKAELQNRE